MGTLSVTDFEKRNQMEADAESKHGNDDASKPLDTIRALTLDIPKDAELVAVDEDIYWLRMPLPFDLDHINLYLIKDGSGFALIDTGIGTRLTESLWENIFKRLHISLSKIIVTHMHPDHIGMAGYLSERFKVPLYMSMSEYYVARSLVAGPQGASDWLDRQYLQACGMSLEYIDKAIENRGGIQKVVRPIPLGFKRLTEGQDLRIGLHTWQVMIGRGHSPEHVCLFCPEKEVLISGDHVLPKISPNIGVYSTEPEANALQLYLDTLPQFKSLPKGTRVLPSHKLPFIGLHQRVDELITHHQTHLSVLKEHCQNEVSVKDCLPLLFKRELNPHNVFFALAEALAHLNYLYYEGEFSKRLNEQGQWMFKRK